MTTINKYVLAQHLLAYLNRGTNSVFLYNRIYGKYNTHSWNVCSEKQYMYFLDKYSSIKNSNEHLGYFKDNDQPIYCTFVSLLSEMYRKCFIRYGCDSPIISINSPCTSKIYHTYNDRTIMITSNSDQIIIGDVLKHPIPLNSTTILDWIRLTLSLPPHIEKDFFNCIELFKNIEYNSHNNIACHKTLRKWKQFLVNATNWHENSSQLISNLYLHEFVK